MDTDKLEDIITKLMAHIDRLNEELEDQEEAGARDRANAKAEIDKLKSMNE